MRTKFFLILNLSALLMGGTLSFAQTNKEVMHDPPAMATATPVAANVIDYLINASPEYSVMVKGLNATGLNETLKEAGPFTVFAVANSGFDVISKDSLEKIMLPENKKVLEQMLSYLILSGDFSLAQLSENVKKSGGDYSIVTIGHGGDLHFGLTDKDQVYIKSAAGSKVLLFDPVVTGNGKVYAIPFLLKPDAVAKEEKEAAEPLVPNK